MILLTGATGFVGRQVHKALAARGVPVRAVIRAGTQARLAAPVESAVTTPDLFAEKAAWWTQACRGIETAIHAAWFAEPGSYLYSPKNKDCVAGTLAFAEGAAQAGLRRFAGIGTCFEYDLSGGTLAVDTPLRPLTPYAQAKADAFTALTALARQRGFAFVWCRLFFLYGEDEDERRLVPYLRRQLAAGKPAELTACTQVRDYLDVAQAGRLIAEDGRRDLLRFGARPNNAFDPPRVVGVR
jgi:dTDP-6-deoxy-L-talose 4-dehydrogenase (NAD+)